MLFCRFELAKHILYSRRSSVRINVGVRAYNIEQGLHIGHVFGPFQGVNIAWRLEGVATLCSPPVVLEVVPTTFKNYRVDWTSKPIPG